MKVRPWISLCLFITSLISSTQFDHMYCNSLSNVLSTKVPILGLSDHFPDSFFVVAPVIVCCSFLSSPCFVVLFLVSFLV